MRRTVVPRADHRRSIPATPASALRTVAVVTGALLLLLAAFTVVEILTEPPPAAQTSDSQWPARTCSLAGAPIRYLVLITCARP
jgi:hypothetical protein